MQARLTWLLLAWVVAAGTGKAATFPPGDPADGFELMAPRVVLTASCKEQQAEVPTPRVWLGVRLARVPDALKAHLGRDGIMVANVVVGSPADDAGLERYDVIVSLDGKAVERFEDLQRILAEIEPGARVAMEIIRGGKARTLTIRPRRRPREPGEVRFKYDEPAAERDITRYFGGRLRQRPDGSWEFEPLGRLRDLLPRELDGDDVPKELREQWHELREQLRREMDELREQLRGLRGRNFGWWPLRQPPGGFRWWFSPYEQEDEDAQMRLRLELRDDEHIVIEKDEQGWHVVRERADGKRSRADYDDLDQLRRDDPDAYDLLRRHLCLGGGFYFRLPPMHRLPELQERFEKEFRQSLREHRRRHERAQAEPAPHAGERRSRRPTEIRRDRERRQIFVVQREGGRIVVRMLEEGRKPETYTFDDLDELREALPEVYEQARELFEQKP